MPDDESIEDKLRRMEGEPEVERLRRENAELRMKLKAAGSNTPRYITPHTLEDELKEVSSHVVLPKGKYIVKGDIIIDESGMLEIEPGTELYFSKYVGIVANGTLRAVGTEQERILFTALYDHWHNISFAGRLSSGSVLEYCVVSRGGGRTELAKRDNFNAVKFPEPNGGGILISYSDPAIRQSRIEQCQANDGGGIYLSQSSPILEGNTIRGNQAGWDGGGIYLSRSNPILEGNTISDNHAAWGGGIYLSKSHPNLTGNIINGNHAERRGGGIYIRESHPNLTDNTINGNHAEQNGGGLNLSKSSPNLTGNTIKDNKPDDILK